MTNGGNIYATIGACSIMGKNAPIYVGLGAGILTLVMTAIPVVEPIDPDTGLPIPGMPVPIPMTTRLLLAAGVGGIAAVGAYVTCTGVSRGITISRR